MHRADPIPPSRRAVVRGARTLLAVLAGASLWSARAAGAQAAKSAQPTLFKDVRVFDGTRALAPQDVLVENGRVARVGRALAAPAGATVVDGRGKTLLPGLIDAHTHSYGDVGRAALAFGVTTELDMFSELSTFRRARAEQTAGQAAGRADLYSAGTLVTAPGGHGTEYGLRIPTITSPDSAPAFVDARLAEGSDWIKIVYDDGHTYGLKYATLSKETMRAVVDATHRRGKLAVVHVGDLAGARDAVDAGADGLVHLFVDQDPDAGFGRLVAGHKAFVIPTLTVLKSITGVGGGAPLVRDARVAPYLSRTDSLVLAQGFPRRPGLPAVSYAAAERAVRQLKAAGVPILAGTDAGNPGTSHGAALHRELELLVQAGLTPAEALAAATSAPAKAFRLTDRGRVAPGLRADLVLVAGDPTADVTATRAVEGVWKGGVRADRAAYAREMAETRVAVTRAPAGSESGLVSDFEGDAPNATAPRVLFGAGWMPTDDARAGGKSTAAVAVADGGANGSARSLAVTGTVSPASPVAWAGAMYSPGAQHFAPANLSAKKELRFWARGDGRTYRVMMFIDGKGMIPLTQSFVAGAEWKEHAFPFSAFGGSDGKGVMAVIFAGGPGPGEFALRVDDVRFR